MKDPHGISSILRPGDYFILDRGFRDVKNFLEAKGYKVLMPALKGKHGQLTTKEANDSRFVTKIRWVVEAVHGQIAQKCKLLHNQFYNRALSDDRTYCQIACLLFNLFGKRLNSDNNKLHIIIDRKKLIKNNDNILAQKVACANYNRKTVPFNKQSSNELIDFPEMTLEELEIFFTGSYQLSQAMSYLAEMLDKEDNTLQLSYLKEEPGIINLQYSQGILIVRLTSATYSLIQAMLEWMRSKVIIAIVLMA